MNLTKTELKLIAECHEMGSAHFFTGGSKKNQRKYDAMMSLRAKGLIRTSLDRCEVQQVSAYGRTRLNGWFRTYLCHEIKLLAGRVI